MKGRDGFPKNRWMFDPTVTITPATSTNPAYEDGFSNQPSPPSSPDSATTEFTTSAYTAVQTEDGVFTGISGNVGLHLYYAAALQRFTFNLSAYMTGGNTITDVLLTWKGYYSVSGSGGSVLHSLLEYYAGSVSTWDTWCSIPTSNTEETLDLGNGSTAFYNTSWIEFGTYCVANHPGTTGIYIISSYTDYAAVTVTYTVPSAAVAPSMVGDGLTWIISILKQKYTSKLFRRLLRRAKSLMFASTN